MRQKVKRLGGALVVEATDKMLVKYRATITLPAGGTEVVGVGNVQTEEQAIEWATYALKLRMEEINTAYAKLFEGYQDPTGLAAWMRRTFGKRGDNE